MSTTRRPYRRGPAPQSNYAPRPAADADADADSKPVPLRKPVFTTIDQLRPQTQGHTLTARVLSARTVLDKGPIQVAECLVGDSTGTVLFTARNQQVEMVKAGSTVIFRNARINMFKGTMRLAVDKWGRIEVVEDPADFKVKENNNVSEVEYELVDERD